MTISYTKNGTDLGTCFEIEKSDLEDKALFPHILTKNTEFTVNFGQMVRIDPNFPEISGIPEIIWYF